MRHELKEEQLEQVVGGTVEFSGSKMRIGFTTLGEGYNVVNCSSSDAMDLVMTMYLTYKSQGDLVNEQKTKEAFMAKGWLA